MNEDQDLDQLSQFRPYKLSNIVQTFQSRICAIAASQLLVIMDISKGNVNNKILLNTSTNAQTTTTATTSPNSQYSNGLVKISMLDYNVKDQIWNHQGLIRDLKISPFASPHLLSASMDKTIRITDLRSQCTLLTFPLLQPAWSCEWSLTNENIVYAGLNNTTVAIFDIRSPKVALEELKPPPNLFGPCNSLISLGPSQTDASSINNDCLIAGTPSFASMYYWNDSSSTSSILFPDLEGKRSIVTKNMQSGNFVISYSTANKQDKPLYKFFKAAIIDKEIEENTVDPQKEALSVESNHTHFREFTSIVSDEAPTAIMSKPAFFTLDNNEVIAIPTRDGLTLRDVNTQSILQTIPRNQSGEISDIKAFSSLPNSMCLQKRTYSSFAGRDYLYTLSNTQLLIYER